MVQAQQAALIDCGQNTGAGTHQLYADNASEEVVLLIFDTKCSVKVNEMQYQIQPFTFLLFPFEEQTLRIVLQSNAVYSWMHLRLTEEYLQKLHDNGLHFKKKNPALHPLAIAEVFKVLLSVRQANTPLQSEIAGHSLELILCLLLQDVNEAERALHVPHYEKLARLRQEIYLHPASSWYIQDICDRLCISRPYFHKIYASAFGTSCTQDVIMSRIAYARRLLESTDDAISQISQQCGFESDVYFMRQFKRHMGMTPTAYRRIYQQSPACEAKFHHSDK